MTRAGALNILIVEDEALLAMDLEAMIEDCGHRVVGEAMSLADVRALSAKSPPDLAFVDMQLADGSDGLGVNTFIREHWGDTAVVFITANPKKIPDDFCGAHGVIPKPFTRAGLMAAMRFISEGILDPPPKLGLPPSFTPAPHIATLWRRGQ